MLKSRTLCFFALFQTEILGYDINPLVRYNHHRSPACPARCYDYRDCVCAEQTEEEEYLLHQSC